MHSHSGLQRITFFCGITLQTDKQLSHPVCPVYDQVDKIRKYTGLIRSGRGGVCTPDHKSHVTMNMHALKKHGLQRSISCRQHIDTESSATKVSKRLLLLFESAVLQSTWSLLLHSYLTRSRCAPRDTALLRPWLNAEASRTPL
jgi:hypothetical protein